MRPESGGMQRTRRDWSRLAACACLAGLALCLVACAKEEPRHSILDDLGLRPKPPSLMVRIWARLVAGSIAAPVSAFCLWAGAKLTKVQHATFMQLLLIAAIGQVVAAIPYAGPVLAMIVMCVLVVKWLEIDFLWDGALMVLVANLVAVWLSFVPTVALGDREPPP